MLGSAQGFFLLTARVFQERVINHAAGSHGVPGIFVKYDTSSLTVTVTEQHMPLWQFLVRLCGIVGGIFSTTGGSGEKKRENGNRKNCFCFFLIKECSTGSSASGVM